MQQIKYWQISQILALALSALLISTSTHADEKSISESNPIHFSLPQGKAWKQASNGGNSVAYSALDVAGNKNYFLYAHPISTKSKGIGDDFSNEVRDVFNAGKSDNESIIYSKITGLEKKKYACVYGERLSENPHVFKMLSKLAVCRNPYQDNTGILVGYSVSSPGEINDDLNDFKEIVNSISFPN